MALSCLLLFTGLMEFLFVIGAITIQKLSTRTADYDMIHLLQVRLRVSSLRTHILSFLAIYVLNEIFVSFMAINFDIKAEDFPEADVVDSVSFIVSSIISLVVVGILSVKLEKEYRNQRIIAMMLMSIVVAMDIVTGIVEYVFGFIDLSNTNFFYLFRSIYFCYGIFAISCDLKMCGKGLKDFLANKNAKTLMKL